MKYITLSLLLLLSVDYNTCSAMLDEQFREMCRAMKPIIRYGNSEQEVFDKLEQKIRIIDSTDVDDFKHGINTNRHVMSSEESRRSNALVKTLDQYVEYSESCCTSRRMSSVELRELYLSNLK